MRIPDIIPVTDLKKDAAAVLARLKESSGPLVVSQRGHAVVVLQSVVEYERARREHEMLKILASGEKEIAAGRGRDLDHVLREADALLGDDS